MSIRNICPTCHGTGHLPSPETNRTRRKKWDSETIEQVGEMRAKDGLTYREIALVLGMSHPYKAQYLYDKYRKIHNLPD